MAHGRRDVAERRAKWDSGRPAHELVYRLAAAGEFDTEHVAEVLIEQLLGDGMVRMVGSAWVDHSAHAGSPCEPVREASRVCRAGLDAQIQFTQPAVAE